VKVYYVYESFKSTQDISFTWNLLLTYDLTHLVGIKDCLAAYQIIVSIVGQEQMFLFVAE
jgi:hypothetical protein